MTWRVTFVLYLYLAYCYQNNLHVNFIEYNNVHEVFITLLEHATKN